MTVARDRAIREVWTAHTDVWLAVRRLDVADALVNASQKSYEATLESYRRGLGTLIDLLAARRELSRARFVALDTKLQLREASAALAFATGEPPARGSGAAGSRGQDREERADGGDTQIRVGSSNAILEAMRDASSDRPVGLRRS